MREFRPGYSIGRLSAANLARALASDKSSPADVKAHGEFGYLLRYLSDIRVRTLVVEHEYTDGDYLDDYTFYYAKAWGHFDRRCKRIHCFSKVFASSDLEELAFGTRTDEGFEEALKKAYCGFIVARPLPSAIIGRTALKTYKTDSGRRHYRRCLRTYKANLLGLTFRVRSLAFQEQDDTVAACATVALWSAFQKTSTLFHTPIPTPAAITNAATQVVHPLRPLPTKGLSVGQLGHAIQSIGLEPEILGSSLEIPFASMVYAYLKAGLPTILIVNVEGHHGTHAIALVGYSLLEKPFRKHEVTARNGGRSRPHLVGRRINEFYGHDDQIGPFARMAIGPGGSHEGKRFPCTLTSEWSHPEDDRPSRLFPHSIVVPVYHKIRVSFVDVYEWVAPFSEVLESVENFDAERAEWDLHLTMTNRLKREVRASSEFGTPAERLLSRHHPRFIWRASLKYDGIRALELLADATGIPHDMPFYHLACLDQSLQDALTKVVSGPESRGKVVEVMGAQFVRFMEKELQAAN